MQINKFKASHSFTFLLLALFLLPACKHSRTEVTICGTLHGYHKKNPNYSYEHLFRFIKAYNPDVIGVEIRPEDVDSTSSFLSKYYPYEMVEAINRFSGKKIYGIDWWNTTIEGEAMSDKVLDTLFNIVMKRKYAADSVFQRTKPDILKKINKERLHIAGKATIEELVMGDYDSLNVSFYEALGTYLKGSPYEKLFDTYMLRHDKLAENMANVVTQNPGKRILFLTGADHQAYARMKIEEVFGANIELNTPFQ